VVKVSSIRLRRSAALGVLPAVLAGATVVAFIQMSAVETHPASMNTVAAAAGIRLVDDDDDTAQLQQQNDESQQETDDEQAQADQQNEIDNDMADPGPDYNNTG
jgi:hypothetical protein